MSPADKRGFRLKSVMSNKDPFNDLWRERFLDHADKAGLLNTDVRLIPRHCPNRHELPDEITHKYGKAMWVQIQECPSCQKQSAKAEMMDKIIDRLARAGVPEMFQTRTTGTLPSNRSERQPLNIDDHNLTARLACSRFGETPWLKTPWLMFAGDVGVGKTTWASALFCDVVDIREQPAGSSNQGLRHTGIRGQWMSEADLFIRCDQAHHKDGYNARTNYLDMVCKSPLLLMDDLGGSRRSLTEWQGGAMRHLFDHRHKHKLPTFMTTNLVHWKDLAARYGEHVVSRMIDRCSHMTTLTGADRRLDGKI